MRVVWWDNAMWWSTREAMRGRSRRTVIDQQAGLSDTMTGKTHYTSTWSNLLLHYSYVKSQWRSCYCWLWIWAAIRVSRKCSGSFGLWAKPARPKSIVSILVVVFLRSVHPLSASFPGGVQRHGEVRRALTTRYARPPFSFLPAVRSEHAQTLLFCVWIWPRPILLRPCLARVSVQLLPLLHFTFQAILLGVNYKRLPISLFFITYSSPDNKWSIFLLLHNPLIETAISPFAELKRDFQYVLVPNREWSW
jgi:hypothetical protein